jgi:hypothetical protein
VRQLAHGSRHGGSWPVLATIRAPWIPDARRVRLINTLRQSENDTSQNKVISSADAEEQKAKSALSFAVALNAMLQDTCWKCQEPNILQANRH